MFTNEKFNKAKINSSWEVSRRSFVKMALISGVLAHLPFVSSCIRENDSDESLTIIDGIDYHLELALIQDVQNILFPKDDLGPGALELKSDSYLIWVLNDKRLDPWDIEYIIKGFQKLDNSSNTKYGSKFIQLKPKQQEDLIQQVSFLDWGQDFLSKILTLIFESMFANPNYGSNPEGIGWKWLNHTPGWPQPEKKQIYPFIIEENENRFKI